MADDIEAVPSVETPPLPHSWTGLFVGMGLVLVVGAIALFMIGKYVASRPVNLNAESLETAQTLNEVLAANRVPVENVDQAVLDKKISPPAHWYYSQYDVILPDYIDADAMGQLIAHSMDAIEVDVTEQTDGANSREFRMDILGDTVASVRMVQTGMHRAVAPEHPAADPPITPSVPLAAPADTRSPQTPKSAIPAGENVPPIPPPASVEPESSARTEQPEPVRKDVSPVRSYPLFPLDDAAREDLGLGSSSREARAIGPETTGGSEIVFASVSSSQPRADWIPATYRAPAAPDNDFPRLAIIVDDGGYGGERTESILALTTDLTLAILPNTPHGRGTAERATALGFEVMLHMPMDNMEDTLRHEGQLEVGMTAEQIQTLARDALMQVPGAVGINNHMGSRFTADPKAMALFFDGIEDRDLFFVDSGTTAVSTAYALASEYGIRAAERDLFLDNEKTEDAIRRRFNQAVDIALNNGQAVAICHFHPVTAAVLAEMLPTLEARGVRLVHASELVR